MFSPDLQASHKLCVQINAIISEFIRSGFQHEIFTKTISLTDSEIKEVEGGDVEILGWLLEKQKHEDRSKIIYSTVFPALLRDMVVCISESLISARKGRMSPAYMLIRKPLQESLYILESMIIEPIKFIELLTDTPEKLSHKNAGGLDKHESRISEVLRKIGKDSILSARYIAQLRYDKSQEDSFDGACNKAMHLFTSHKSIKTEQLNLNFIFSDSKAIITQQKFYYSRFAYIAYYIYYTFEFIAEQIHPTQPEYLNQMNDRIAAGFSLIGLLTDDHYQTDHLDILAEFCFSLLNKQYPELISSSNSNIIRNLDTILTNGVP